MESMTVKMAAMKRSGARALCCDVNEERSCLGRLSDGIPMHMSGGQISENPCQIARKPARTCRCFTTTLPVSWESWPEPYRIHSKFVEHRRRRNRR
ncbi:hypothetical protein COOONC_21182 [Cooperia oncophora]